MGNEGGADAPHPGGGGGGSDAIMIEVDERRAFLPTSGWVVLFTIDS